MPLRDAALALPGRGTEEGGSRQAAEALITEAEQGQPCGNCVQLTDGTGRGRSYRWRPALRRTLENVD